VTTNAPAAAVPWLVTVTCVAEKLEMTRSGLGQVSPFAVRELLFSFDSSIWSEGSAVTVIEPS
jgi:hypothetical protein